LSAKTIFTLLLHYFSRGGLLLLTGCGPRALVVTPPTFACEGMDSKRTRASCESAISYSWSRDNSEIVYPPVLTQAGVSGRVHVLLWVSVAGLVDSSHVESATNSIFARSVDIAVRRWRFKLSRPNANATIASQPHRPVEVEVVFGFIDCPIREALKPRAYALRTRLLVEVAVCADWIERRRVGFSFRPSV
jgi:TonB family protein